MRLSDANLLVVWEQGEGQHPVQQALALLSGAFPDRVPHDLAELPIGRRDALLLDAHALTFGPQLDALADCPQCGETLELHFLIDDIRTAPPEAPANGEYWLSAAGYQLRFRLPNSSDLVAIAQAAHTLEVAAARTDLIRRCILGVALADAPLESDELPADVVAVLAARMAEYDPQAEVWLSLTCPACAHAWQVLFDIVTFLWAKVEARAKSLLREVHTLASAYGWSEAAILALSPLRRQFYLDASI